MVTINVIDVLADRTITEMLLEVSDAMEVILKRAER